MTSPLLQASAASNDTSIPDLDFEEMDIHGKLVTLNAVDLSTLTSANRCAMILLSGPWCSDDLGRFMGPPGFLPELSALSKRQTSTALRALVEKGLINTWMSGGTRCWEVAGAYAFKKNLKAGFKERQRLGRLKRVMRGSRKERRNEEFQGDSYLKEDDGSMRFDGVVEAVRTTRGGHVPMQPTMFHRSKVPTPKGSGKHKLIVPQPTDEACCIFHLYPSLNVYAGLSELGVVLRHQLLWTADDYGRVRIDIPRLHSELGPAITKRVSMKDIELEIDRMSGSGHLLLFRRASGTYAYVRDAAQHLKKRMFRDMNLPKLVEDKEFTHDSDTYKAFIESCRALAIIREKVYLREYTKDGTLHVIHEYVEVPAKRFLESYHKIMNTDRYIVATVDTIADISWRANTDRLRSEEMFYYGYLNKMPFESMESMLHENENGFGKPDSNDFKILRYLMGMTPQEYVDKLRKESIIGQSSASTRVDTTSP